MKKMVLLLVVGAALTLSGCAPWGCWGGHGHDHGNDHSHHRGCGHPGY